ncbi:MAG TPA: 2,3-bisphosphoglycerate-independent phosphoglycerate mutase [Methylococcaceae bacterium]|nr:2,3-bisphosphoglycerate-independent phosphoglycerate mutase [Methylococcaceae bacterium]
MTFTPPKPVLLLILDGFGYSESPEHNAVLMARTPVWDALWRDWPHTLLDCSGAAVGLPDDQMGNSEVGHLHLGCGRLLAQELTRINNAVHDGSFYRNAVLIGAADRARESGTALHIMGLLSPGGVHSHEDHLLAMVDLAIRRGLERIYIHAFLDGRDTPPRSAGESIAKFEARLAELGHGRIATLSGRFYAMDRDKRWDRVQQAYAMLVDGHGAFSAPSAAQGLEAAYQRGENDEFVLPTTIVPPGTPAVKMEDGDVVVFMNFRADRTRELSLALTADRFDGFERARVPRLGDYVTLTEYHQDFAFPVAFPPDSVANSLGELLSRRGLKQLRLAETEKYAHVTFFFNGGIDTPFEGEERILVPSPKVKTYDLQPEMSAPEVTDHLVAAIEGRQYDVIVCNYANGDMVGHTGNLDAAIHAVETLDACLGRVLDALNKVGGELLLTSDHGNAEQMVDPESGQMHTAHTMNPVPLVYRGRPAQLADGGNLADVAPTLLAVMGIPQPSEMTGRSLLLKT